MSDGPQLPPGQTRVLCYSPYTKWELHGLWETTILHGLRLRGADVRHVLCDGLYEECDLTWGTVNPRQPLSCVECQFQQARLMLSMGSDYEWLGRYLMPAEQREARRFVATLVDADLPSAEYDGWKVGEWVKSSVHSHFREARLDLADPRVAHVYRQYAVSGLIAAFGLTRLLDDFDPHVVLQFNGRQSSTRVAFELARARGIRVITHETGHRAGHIALADNDRAASLGPIRRTWADWGGVPLSDSELAEAREYLDEREHGRAQYYSFSPPPQSPQAVRDALSLDAGRRLWVLFTSSDDEVAADADWQGPMPSQPDWIERTVAYASDHPELDLVVRVHPNSGSARSLGRNESLLRWFEELGRRLPANVRLVRADDDVSSYTLMNLCDVGLVWHSSVALELATKGKRTVVAAGCPVRGFGFTVDVEEPDRYEEILDEVAGSAHPPAEQVRLAHRFVYRVFCARGLAFPLIEMVDQRVGRPAYSSLAELEPGCDSTLDRICHILLDGERVSPPPTPADLSRGTEAEDAFLRDLSATRRAAFAVLAAAEEVIADTTILGAWASQFSGADDATLFVETTPTLVDALVAAVANAGLDGDDTADIVATATPPSDVAAVLSRRAAPARPTFTPERAAELRSLAMQVWAAA